MHFSPPVPLDMTFLKTILQQLSSASAQKKTEAEYRETFLLVCGQVPLSIQEKSHCLRHSELDQSSWESLRGDNLAPASGEGPGPNEPSPCLIPLIL